MTPTHLSVSRKYDFLSRFYDFIWRHYTQKTISRAISLVRLKGNEKICDIGCGTGALEEALFILHPSLSMDACDISGRMVERARKKLGEKDNLSFFVGDFLNFPFEKEGHDLLFSLSNFHYFKNPEAILKKGYDMIKPGGEFVLVDWCRDGIRAKAYRFYMKFFDKSFCHVYTIEEINTLLAKTGWKVERVETFSIRCFWEMMAIRARRM